MSTRLTTDFYSPRIFFPFALLVSFILFALVAPQIAYANCLDNPRLTGVNISGAEFNSTKLPGVPEKDYTYPSPPEINYVAAQGANIIRLPFRWERLQPTVMTPLDENELTRMRNVVDLAKAQGLCVILDVHNYAKYFNQNMAGDKGLQDAFVDLWTRMAVAFPDEENTIFGLMNEPKYITIAEWATLAKRTIVKLRNAKSKNLILVAGGNWSGAHDWFNDHDGMSNAVAFENLRDKLNRTFIEVHQYADSNFSGTGTTCQPADQFVTIFGKITTWARDHQQYLFLGEFGTPNTPDCLNTLERFLTLTRSEVWQGWTYWSVGRWWAPDYPLLLNVNSDKPSPQWAILKKYFFNIDKAVYKVNPPKPPKPTSR
jgi:endoglucanase